MGLLQRLLAHSERQQVRLDNAYQLIRRLREICQVLQNRLERVEADSAAEIATADVFCEAAMKELLARRGQDG